MTFKDEILADIDWRISELASLRTIPFKYGMTEEHQSILIKYTVLPIYALWEGFVKNSFRTYIRELNSLDLSVQDAHINLLTHAISSIDKLKLENPRLHFKSQKEFIEFYHKQMTQSLNIGQKLPTKSNVNFKVINEFLERFNLKVLPSSYKIKLEKLLNFRNKIAHGNNSIPVKKEDIDNFSLLVSDLMIEIYERIEDGFDKKTYKNK